MLISVGLSEEKLFFDPTQLLLDFANACPNLEIMRYHSMEDSDKPIKLNVILHEKCPKLKEFTCTADIVNLGNGRYCHDEDFFFKQMIKIKCCK